MQRTTKYVALDVHQATTVASVREESGRVIARSVLPTEAAALLEFVRGMRGAIHVAFEEGTQAQWLHELLVPQVDRVVVCDRRGEARQGNKGDFVDADQLSEVLRRGGLRPGTRLQRDALRGSPGLEPSREVWACGTRAVSEDAVVDRAALLWLLHNGPGFCSGPLSASSNVCQTTSPMYSPGE
jgi:hypothetical protein